MRIAVFDYQVIATNPIGGCHLRMLEGLCREHEFTVFAVRFDNPCPDRIRFVRVPVPTRPLALLFLAYHLIAPICYLLHRARHRVRFDVVQSVESNLSFGRVCYAQFCHRAFLREHWPRVGTRDLRGRLRWLDHWLHARGEAAAFRRSRHIVVPSPGLARELDKEFPPARGKVSVIPNPVDTTRMRCPDDFDRGALRSGLGWNLTEVVLAFVALGHFERKGLPVLFEAVARIPHPQLRLLVVGGEQDLISVYRRRAERLGIADRVGFAGMQRDIRPFLWAADAFVLPSFYEAFPLVSMEAAASGLPLIVTPLHGVEDIIKNGENGFLVPRTPDGLVTGITRFLTLSPGERSSMGEQARRAVQKFSKPAFIAAWRNLYRDLDVA